MKIITIILYYNYKPYSNKNAEPPKNFQKNLKTGHN